MRANKRLTIFTFLITIIALVSAILIGKEPASIEYDVAMAIFGSAFLGCIMSLIQYFAERRSAMETFYNEALRAVHSIKKIKYMHIEVPIDLVLEYFHEEECRQFEERLGVSPHHHNAQEKVKSWCIENGLIEKIDGINSDKMYTLQVNSLMDSYKEDIRRSIACCLQIAETDFSGLSNAYGKMDFIWGNFRFRKWVYTNIYSKIHDFSFHISELNRYINPQLQDHAMFVLQAKVIYDFNKTIFYVCNKSGTGEVAVYAPLWYELDNAIEKFRCSIYRSQEYKPVLYLPVFRQFGLNK